ncbi:MAG TPA: sugar ABC transporter permease [Pseudothermotoga sp.]|nr:sugar ABC transporter permease [Pseudothermotoga sp.]HOK83163.1 sugar ABC transporter permease [Pseudothermotoga sp.]HPP69666.1 sugar ABC transporter permease [Pseudothermotoga sp.]
MNSFRETKKAFPYLLPLIIIIAVVSVYPFVRGVLSSLYGSSIFGNAERFVGISNFKALFNDDLFWLSLRNNLIWVVCCVSLEFVFGLLIASLLNLQCVKMRNLFRALVLLPWATPPVVAGLVWRYILATNGPLNIILKTTGLMSNPPSWLITPGYSLTACVVVNIWLGLPFMSIMLLAGLQAIPSDVYEAARMDGANAFQKFCHITMPMMKSVIAVVVTLMCIWTFNTFDVVYVLTNGGPGNSSLILSLYGYQNVFAYYQRGYGASIGVISLLILLIPVSMYIRALLKEVEAE